MAFGTIASIGIAGAGAISNMRNASDARDKAREAGRANYDLIKMETAEQVRRIEMQNESRLGLLNARIGASGVKARGTPTVVRQAMEKEQAMQLDWTQKSGDSRAIAAKKQGSYIGAQAQAQGQSAMWQGIGQIANLAIQEWGQ